MHCKSQKIFFRYSRIHETKFKVELRFIFLKDAAMARSGGRLKVSNLARRFRTTFKSWKVLCFSFMHPWSIMDSVYNFEVKVKPLYSTLSHVCPQPPRSRSFCRWIMSLRIVVYSSCHRLFRGDTFGACTISWFCIQRCMYVNARNTVKVFIIIIVIWCTQKHRFGARLHDDTTQHHNP